MKTQALAGTLLVLSAAMLWGTTGTAQSFAPPTLSSYWVGTMRLMVAGVFFLIWMALGSADELRPAHLRGLPWIVILLAALSMAIYNLAFFASIRATSVALGTTLALGSGPVWAGFLQIVVTRKAPTIAWWLAVLICVTGLILTTLGSQGSIKLPLTGVALCLLSGFSYAVYALATKHIVATTSPGLATATVFTLAAIMALPAAGLLAGVPEAGTSDVWVMLWLGVVATGAAYLLFSAGLRWISSATGVALALAEPITAVILAVVILGERLSPVSFAGLLLMFAGLSVLIRSEVSDSRKAD